jgi:hypothetical protein
LLTTCVYALRVAESVICTDTLYYSLWLHFTFLFFHKRFPCFLLKAPITFRFVQVSSIRSSIARPYTRFPCHSGLHQALKVSNSVKGLQAIIGGLKLLLPPAVPSLVLSTGGASTWLSILTKPPPLPPLTLDPYYFASLSSE